MSGVYTLGVEVASHKVYDVDRTRTALDSLTVDGRRWVAIDPEDREAVERLAKAYFRIYWELPSEARNLRGDQRNPDARHFDTLASALREFANPTPPKPDEPTGLGAVVEDADGEVWVRHPLNRDDLATWCSRTAQGAKWSDVRAVRVLSEGVTA